MTFPLIRLPLLTLREVIKSMNVREIVLFLSVSKKCQYIVKASISKKSSLEISFSPERNSISAEISPKSGFHFKWLDQKHGSPLRIGDNILVTAHFSTCGNCAKFNLTRSGQEAQDEELIKTVLKYFTDTIKPLVKFNFYEHISQDLAMEVIRYCRLNHIRLFSIYFSYGKNASPEYVREILEGRIEDGNLCIYSSLPRGFEYTPPPGGFKLQRLFVSNAHWVNLNDFLQCEHVHLYRGLHHMTPEYLNNVYKTIVNEECKIKFLKLISNEFSSYSFPELFRGLTDRPIRDFNGVAQCVEFEENDGRTTTIIHHSDVIVLRRE